MSNELNPMTREETFLAKAAGQNVEIPRPITRVEMFLKNLIDHISQIGNGSGGSGTTAAQSDWDAAEGEPGHILNRTHWVGSGMVEIPVTGEWKDSSSYAITTPLGLEAGKTYTVTWDGVNYEVTAKYNVLDGIPCVNIGNFTGETNEPFVIGELDAETAAEMGFYGMAMVFGTSGYVDFSIYTEGEIVHKLDNKYLDLDWLPTKTSKETEVASEITSAGFTDISTTSVPVGTEVIVTFDGVRYPRTVQFLGDVPYFGNLGAANSELTNTGEPFLFIDAEAEGVYYLWLADDTTEHTISVHKQDYEYNVIPEGYLGGNTGTLTVDLEALGMPTADPNNDVTFSTNTKEIYRVLQSGGKVYVKFEVDLRTEGSSTPLYMTALLNGNKVGNDYCFSTLVVTGVGVYAVELRIENDGYVHVKTRRLALYE